MVSSGTAPVFSYKLDLSFLEARAGTWLQDHITTMNSLTYLIYLIYPYCNSRVALTLPAGTSIALNPINPQIFTNASLGYCQTL